MITAGAEPAVATFVDGVYQARAYSALKDFYDIERVEVVKGPQGTLYGRNATAGAVNIISKTAGPDFEAEADIVYGNYDKVRVRGLAHGRATYERLGFKLTPISFHKERASANRLIVLERDYTEIVGLAPGAEADAILSTFFEARGGGGGMSFIGLMSEDAEADGTRLRDQGFTVNGPAPLERPVDYPEYQGLARFNLTMIETPEHPLVQFFFTQHLTSEALHIPGYEAHPNTAIGIAAVYIVADDPGQLRPLLEALFGAGRLSAEGAGLCAKTDNGDIYVMTPDEVPRRFAESPPAIEGTRPYVLGQRLRVANLDRARDCLIDGGAPFAEAADGALTIQPKEACGALLQFAASA